MLDARAILNGVYDMRAYPHRYLTVYATPTPSFADITGVNQPDHDGCLTALTACVDWLDQQFEWEPISVFTRQTHNSYIHHAMLRRREPHREAAVTH